MKTKTISAGFVLSALALVTIMLTLPACAASTPATVTATVTVTHPSTSTATATVTGSLLNGQDIFLTAVDANGIHLTAQGFAMMTRAFACADCHGTDGHGGTVYMMMTQYEVPNITWASLTGPDYTPAFTVDTLKRAITQGLDEKGKALAPFMPRWSMSAQDLSDLVSYLQTLK